MWLPSGMHEEQLNPQLAITESAITNSRGQRDINTERKKKRKKKIAVNNTHFYFRIFQPTICCFKKTMLCPYIPFTYSTLCIACLCCLPKGCVGGNKCTFCLLVKIK